MTSNNEKIDKLRSDLTALGGDRAKPEVKNANDLLARQFAPLAWLVPGIFPCGCFLVAAKPKIGKSWLTLQLAVATATGGRFFDRPVSQGQVLYLGLEDSDRRLSERLKKFVKAGDDLSQLDYQTQWAKGETGIDDIRSWVTDHDDARLIVIDVLAKLRDGTGQINYQDDYQDVAAFQQIIGQRDITILIVHHTRKATSDSDVMDEVSGTLGLTGGVDGTLVLKRGRGEDEAELHLSGRDLVDEGEFWRQIQPRYVPLGVGRRGLAGSYW